MEEIFDQMNDEVDQNTVDKQCAEIERKNLLIANENLIANCLSNQLLYDVEKSRCLDLEAEMSKVHNESKGNFKLKGININFAIIRRCEPYNANDVLLLIEQNECVRVELKRLIEEHLKVAARSSVKKQKFLSGMYAIDEKPSTPRLKNQ
ncbi:hypothetical protein Tco_0611512 [Tanacetum coccineum]